jgi:hypothetical protein
MLTEYNFFWSGPFSQWSKAQFTDDDGISYNCAEQYMMYKKAIFFEDYDIAEQILKEKNPRNQKSLGRKVKNFNKIKWDEIAKDVVFQGNVYKFSQNKKHYESLMKTKGTLVEASPYDRVWGIGLSENVAKYTPPDKWPGLNWLGITLTEVREYLSKL